jgi:hypothetical protein
MVAFHKPDVKSGCWSEQPEAGCKGKINGKGHGSGVSGLSASAFSSSLVSVGLDDKVRLPCPLELAAATPHIAVLKFRNVQGTACTMVDC